MLLRAGAGRHVEVPCPGHEAQVLPGCDLGILIQVDAAGIIRADVQGDAAGSIEQRRQEAGGRLNGAGKAGAGSPPLDFFPL